MQLLFDGDIIIYRAAAAAEPSKYYVYIKGEEEYGYIASFKYKKEMNSFIKGEEGDFVIEKKKEIEPVANALNNIDTTIDNIVSVLNFTSTKFYLTGTGNFREKLYPDYKAHRKDVERPVHLMDCTQYLIEKYGAIVIDGMEADDAMSIEQYKDPDTSCIVSLDKDLDMVPGGHYNWVRGEYYEVKELDGLRWFYTQVLTGDSVDNIKGLKGIGPKGAQKLLKDCNTEKEMFDVCVDKYNQRHIRHSQMDVPSGCSYEDLILNCKLLWMSKKEPNDWRVPA